MRLIALLITLLLGSCDSADQPADTSSSAADKDGFQVIADARLVRESFPGKTHYEAVCASCHNGNLKKAPHKDMIGLLTADAVLKVITTGIMQNEASSLTPEQKVEVAEYVAGVKLGGHVVSLPQCEASIVYTTGLETSGANWGLEPGNERAIPAELSGITSANISTLKPKWSIAMPGSSRVRSQPTFAGGLILVGSHGGIVYALDPESGCAVWSFQAAGEVRTGIAISETAEVPMAFFGDVLANAYGVNALTGELVWRLRTDDHPNATITGSPTPYNGMLYIPVSSLEVSLAVDPQYECCTFRGSVVAVDATTGAQKWKAYTIPDEPSVSGKNPVGTNIIGPSGAVVWNSPSIDSVNNQLFIGTGENMSAPASLTSDALMAIDLDSGKINWVFQATVDDVWNGACDTTTPENCPVENGPDFDFGGATVIVNTSAHGRLVVAGQKSGFVHALNPETGALVWQTRVGRGGIQGGIHFGIAASGETLLVPISDMADGRTYPNPDRPGMHAVDANTGKILWSTLHDDNCGDRDACHPGISQVVTVVGDLVIGGAMDGIARAYSIKTGEILWQLDTTSSTYRSVSGAMATGGSMGGAAGPIAYKGTLLLSSGYGIYNHMAGDLLLALSVE